MIILCGQDDIARGECPECGGALRRPGVEPVRVSDGPAVCDEECAASYCDRRGRSDVGNHLRLRDLLCECAQICAPRGLPTAEMRAEYATYLASAQ